MMGMGTDPIYTYSLVRGLGAGQLSWVNCFCRLWSNDNIILDLKGDTSKNDHNNIFPDYYYCCVVIMTRGTWFVTRGDDNSRRRAPTTGWWRNLGDNSYKHWWRIQSQEGWVLYISLINHQMRFIILALLVNCPALVSTTFIQQRRMRCDATFVIPVDQQRVVASSIQLNYNWHTVAL